VEGQLIGDLSSLLVIIVMVGEPLFFSRVDVRSRLLVVRFPAVSKYEVPSSLQRVWESHLKELKSFEE
jgi:hypothetical protein